MMLLNTGPKTGLAPDLVRQVTTVSGIVALLWWLRASLFHLLDVALSYARGLPTLRDKNTYLKGAPLWLHVQLRVSEASVC